MAGKNKRAGAAGRHGAQAVATGRRSGAPERAFPARERAILVGLDSSASNTARNNATKRSPARRGKLYPDSDAADSLASESHSAFGDSDTNQPAAASTSLNLEESLAEFRELVSSAGGEVVAEILQRRSKPDPATLVGSGKVEEIAAVAASTNADLVLFDHDLTPTQLRNLEAALPCRVLDRTQLILDIFARHARTREGQLQVERAQLEYMLPRLTGRGKSMSQLGGGIGTRGPGETQLETDRRKIQRRIDQLKLDLEAVRSTRRQQRQRREATPVPTVALVGYTNAGKSTLFNALTGADVLSSPQMFATLDPKLRSIELPSRRKILLSDTVGFLRNLPHTLVNSFRATLEEVAQAEVLVHVGDAAAGYAEEQKAQVEKVLGELDVLSKPRIEVLNKIDLLPTERRQALRERAKEGAEAAVSALTREGLDDLLRLIDEALFTDPVIEAEFRIPQHEGAALAAIEAGMVVHSRDYEGNLVRISATGPASLVGRMRRFQNREA